MTLPTTKRAGSYYRVCKPGWLDASDTAFAKLHGGRWNPAGEFGARYLNATTRVAAAQARHQHAGRAIGLFDLRPERRPELATVEVPALRVLDVVTRAALEQLGLPASYPIDVEWPDCQAIARRAYAEPLASVAARSAAEARPTSVVGEELAVFDTVRLRVAERRAFPAWYPDPAPNR